MGDAVPQTPVGNTGSQVLPTWAGLEYNVVSPDRAMTAVVGDVGSFVPTTPAQPSQRAPVGACESGPSTPAAPEGRSVPQTPAAIAGQVGDRSVPATPAAIAG